MKIKQLNHEKDRLLRNFKTKNMKKYYNKLPFWLKMWWAKQFIYMFKGFGPTFDNDVTLYNELRLWIDTKGKPNK